MKEFHYGEIDQTDLTVYESKFHHLYNNHKSNTLIKAAETLKNQTKEGLKFDTEKPDLSLLPIEFLSEVAKAMMHGEKKYGRYNYTNGMAWHRIIAASLRHIYAFASGEDLDTESGISHLGHAGACVLMLLVYYKRNLGEDTREKR